MHFSARTMNTTDRMDSPSREPLTVSTPAAETPVFLPLRETQTWESAAHLVWQTGETRQSKILDNFQHQFEAQLSEYQLYTVAQDLNNSTTGTEATTVQQQAAQLSQKLRQQQQALIQQQTQARQANTAGTNAEHSQAQQLRDTSTQSLLQQTEAITQAFESQLQLQSLSFGLFSDETAQRGLTSQQSQPILDSMLNQLTQADQQIQHRVQNQRQQQTSPAENATPNRQERPLSAPQQTSRSANTPVAHTNTATRPASNTATQASGFGRSTSLQLTA